MVFRSTLVWKAGSGNGVGVTVGGSGLGLAVKLAVGEGGTKVAVGVRETIAVSVAGSGISVFCIVGKALQAAVPAMHRTIINHRSILVFMCLIF